MSVRGTKCTTEAADGFSHILLSMAVHPSEPLRCLGTGLMLVEGITIPTARTLPAGERQWVFSLSYLPSLPAVQFIVLAVMQLLVHGHSAHSAVMPGSELCGL